MQKTGRKYTLVTCAGFILATTALAQTPTAPDRRTPVANRGSAAEKPFRVQKATSLIGKRIVNQRGETVGTIEDLMVDPDRQGHVSYAIVSLGDSPVTVNRRTAVPLTAMNLQGEGEAEEFTIDLTDEQRQNFPTFPHDQWPTMDDPMWAARTYEFFGQSPYWSAEDGTTPVGSDVKLRSERVRDLIGRPVQNSRGQNMGRVEDFAIDPDTGRIAYNVLSLEGSANAANRYYAIPANTLDFPANARSGIFNADSERMQNAPSFERTHWPKLADPVYASTVYKHYEQQPYWMHDDQADTRNVRNNAANPVRKDTTKGPNATNPPNATNRSNYANPPASPAQAQPKDNNPPREKP